MVAFKQHEVKFDLRIEISILNYPGIHVHVAFNDHLGGLSVKFDLRFEISNLNYLGIHVHIATAILVASEAIAASK